MYILYGTQNGNAEYVAIELCNRLASQNPQVLSLNEALPIFERKEFNEDFIIVTSTTGNGEIPLSAERWWRFIKNRQLDNKHLTGLKFHLLAIGDTNYDKFCEAGKKVCKRLLELNATKISDVMVIDDSLDEYEEKLDKFEDRFNEGFI